MARSTTLRLSLVVALLWPFLSFPGPAAGQYTPEVRVLDLVISASANDAHQACQGGRDYMSVTFGVVQVTAASGACWGRIPPHPAGFRWPVAGLGQGDRILEAYFEGYSVGGRRTIRANLYFQNSASPGAFSPGRTAGVSGRPRTSASVRWHTTFPGDGWYRSPSLTGPLQELVDRMDPSALVLLFIADNSDPTDRALFESYDGSPSRAARLHIEYTKAPPQPQVSSLVPQRLDDAHVWTVSITGESFDTGDLQAQVSLTGAGGAQVDCTEETGTPIIVTARCDLRGATPGLWDLLVTNGSGRSTQLPGALEVLRGLTAASDGKLRLRSSYPAPGDTEVSPSADVTATFDRSLDPATVTPENFLLREGFLLGPVSRSLSLDPSGSTISLTPEARLEPGTTHLVTVGRELRGVDGAALGTDYTFSFVAAGSRDYLSNNDPTAQPLYRQYQELADLLAILAGALAALSFAWGGYTYMTAMGEPRRVEQGRNAMAGALSGLLMALLARTVAGIVVAGTPVVTP